MFRGIRVGSGAGIGGGVICHQFKGKLQVESNPSFHVRGANKIYKRACWKEIACLMRAPGWDTIDEVKANMLGWRTRSFEGLKVIHHRFTGAANGVWRNSIKNGMGSYISGCPLLLSPAHPSNFLQPPTKPLWSAAARRRLFAAAHPTKLPINQRPTQACHPDPACGGQAEQPVLFSAIAGRAGCAAACLRREGSWLDVNPNSLNGTISLP